MQADATEKPTISAPKWVSPGWSKTVGLPVLFGALAAFALFGLYAFLITRGMTFEYALDQFSENAWLAGPVMAAFGVQVGLYTYLRSLQRNLGRAPIAMAGAGGGTGTAAMVACCAHYVTNVLPFVGLSAATIFLGDNKELLLAIGLGMNLIGIAVTTRAIIRARGWLAAKSLKGA